MDNYANPYPYNCYPPPPSSSSSQPHPNPYESPPNLYISPFTSFPPQSPHLNPQLNYADPSQYPLVYPSPSFDAHYQPYPYPDPNSSSFHHGGSSHYDPSPSPSLSSSSSASSFHPINEDLASMHISDPGADAGSQHGSLKVLLLHGKLDVTVKEAKNLPDAGFFSKTIGNFFSPSESVPPSGELGKSGKSDAYVKIMIGPVNIGATYVVRDNENPAWMQHFNLPVAHETAAVTFEVMDNVLYPRHIGSVSIPAGRVYSGEKVEGTYPIIGTNGNPCKNGAMLSLSIQYIPMARLSLYYQGVGYGPDYYGVPNTYFQSRKGCKVTLYQDAHVPDGCLPDLRLDYGMHYNHGKCWQDIYVAINQARRLVYITGWSVFETVHLVRDGDNASSLALGELLKSKSQDGVRVLLLVWDDPTSKSILFLKKTGIMDTHDEEIQHFFKHSSVQVLLCPRSAGKHNSWFRQQETRTIFTHHQKTVVVDADAGNGKRKIVAFIGGLDLCGGRYDTPRHPLFRTLQTLHMDDYHNPNFVGPDARGPREPWHDLHSKIDGPAAYDILKNFEERWLKASKRHGIKKLGKSHDDALLKIKRIPDIIDDNNPLYLTDTDPETWHVQIFRSIDSNSVKGFPKDPRVATRENLVCGKNVLIDMSIHAAYVHAIRAAQHFIYIENQYFLGSSFNWHSNKDSGANNLIPIEIALKIANKIRANERFSAYIVLPMWPEGSPTGATTQMILFWQNKTMWMMYETIYRALKEVGLEDQYEPQDYLNFFCLGNREAEDINNPSDGIPHAPNTPQEHARKNRRFMIYVHSKGMIVDDEYVIIGSANINQRSLEGTRDTEIAMGAYQPQYTWAKKFSAPRGQIYGYRMSLWAEHIGTLEESFSHPESLDCMRRVRALGELNWRQFAADEVTEMRGHLLKYPVDVDRKGKVNEVMHNLKESFNYAEGLECVRRVRTVGEQNWIQFAADAITEMRSHLLKNPVDVDRKALTWLQDLPGYWWKYVVNFLEFMVLLQYEDRLQMLVLSYRYFGQNRPIYHLYLLAPLAAVLFRRFNEVK